MRDTPEAGEPKLRLGVSSCLLGEQVRHDGGHKRDRFLTDELGRWVEWVPVCPEVEAGMPIPRPAIRLVEAPGGPVVREVRGGADHTRRMREHARRRVRALAKLDLGGYVLKKDSPSCGMERVKLWKESGPPSREARGVFARELLERLPLLPVEEEGRLNDAQLRESFVERIFAYRRLRRLFDARWTARQLVEFHATHKLQLMSHAPRAVKDLGQIVAGVRQLPRAEVRERYERGFMELLAHKATTRRHVNVLQHMLGYLRRGLDGPRRQELAELIEDYRSELVPLIVPVTLMRHHVRHLGVAYLAGQTYLEPHPRELMLRNHV